MIKRFTKFYLLFFALALLCTNTYGQVLDRIKQTFNNYYKDSYHEKLYVHTDKDSYVVGELLWLKVYNLEANANVPADLSKVAYVEVIDNEGHAIVQSKISMTNGLGNGAIDVPVNVNTGYYTLRAYTNLMKNDGPEVFFEKPLRIFNPVKAPERSVKGVAYDLQFFPEGGDLIAGIQSKVAFKITASDGKGIDVNGVIINQRNETVAQFKTSKFGIGHFIFTPNANDSYKALINTLPGIPMKDLPSVKPWGYSLSLTDGGNGQLSLRVNANIPSPASVYLLVHRGKKIVLAESGRAGEGATQFLLDKTKLEEGISTITLFDAAGNPVCERLYFKKPASKLVIQAQPDASQYKTRSKVNIQIQSSSEQARLLESNLSLAVYRLDSLVSSPQSDIFSYLWLGADLRGYIESPMYYFQSDNKEMDDALDGLMLTHGWRTFKWNKVLSGNKPVLKFLPELNGHLVMGRLTDDKGRAATNKVVYLGIASKMAQFYGATTDSTGHFAFNTKDLYGLGELTLQTNFDGDSLYRITVQSPFDERARLRSSPAFSFKPSQLASLEMRNLSAQVQQVYAADKLRQFYYPGIDSTAFYGQPSKSYPLEDFTRFPTMEEVLREYVMEVNVVRQQRQFHIKVFNELKLIGGDPLVLLDGVPFFNMDQVMKIDPLKVKQLDLVTNRYFWGPTISDGILHFKTYDGNLGGTVLDPKVLIVDYEGMQLQREFYSPIYDNDEQRNSRIPDQRSTLYWSPDVRTDIQGKGNLSFFTSDIKGKFMGVIEGISRQGVSGSKVFTFDVK